MSVAATIPSLLPLVMVAAMRRAEARIHRQLVDAGAITEATAIPLSLSRSMDRRRLHGLVSGGAVHATTDGRHFLDAEGWTRYHDSRRRRVMLAAAIAVAVLGIGAAVLFLALR